MNVQLSEVSGQLKGKIWSIVLLQLLWDENSWIAQIDQPIKMRRVRRDDRGRCIARNSLNTVTKSVGNSAFYFLSIVRTECASPFHAKSIFRLLFALFADLFVISTRTSPNCIDWARNKCTLHFIYSLCLHSKIAGCFKEEAETRTVDIEFSIWNLRVINATMANRFQIDTFMPIIQVMHAEEFDIKQKANFGFANHDRIKCLRIQWHGCV